MAQFTLDSGNTLHKLDGRLPNAPQLKLDALDGIKMPNLGAAAGGGFDFLGDVSRMASAVQKRGGSEPVGIKFDEFDVSVPQLVIDAPKKDPIEALFRRAHQLLETGDHEGAAKLFDQVLAQRPDHNEARYLRALCAAKLGDHMLALRTLAALAPVRLDDRLVTRVNILRGQLRESIELRIFVQVALASRVGNPSALLAELEELATLDPECGQYHYLLAGFLLTVDQVTEARAAVERGLGAIRDPEVRAPLVALQREIIRRWMREALAPVYKHYRARDYRAAATALAGSSDEVRRSDVGELLGPYLKKLQGGLFSRKKSPKELYPEGDPKVLDDFHFGVIADELRQYRMLAAVGDAAGARRLLLAAYEHAPAFPFLRFQLGSVLFHIAVEQLRQGSDFERGFMLLDEAKVHASYAVQDPEITAAPGLLEVIEQLEGERHDMEVLGTIFERFAAVMVAAKDGVGTMAKFRETRAGLSGVQAAIHHASLMSASGRQNLAQLAQVVEVNLKQLTMLEPEIAAAEARSQLIARVNGLGERFAKIMNSASDGISSAQRANELLKSLEALKKDVTKSLREIENNEALEVLGQLTHAIDRNLDQLKDAVSSIGEAETFKGLVNKFELAMKTLNGGNVHDRKGVLAVVGLLRDVRTQSGVLQRNAKNSSIRTQAGDLEAAISNILGQIGL